MRLAPESAEPIIGNWRCIELDVLVGQLPAVDAARPRIILVDGRSAGGKTTFAAQLRTGISGAAVVHTDDVAWNYSMFDWADALVDHIILPARDGEPIDYRPPGWAPNGRHGAIELPAHLDTLIVEGVGAGRRQIARLADVLIWIQSDFPMARERGLVRDIAIGTNGSPDECRRFWDWWMAAELPFLERETPWSRADLIVAGSAIAACSGQAQLAVYP